MNTSTALTYMMLRFFVNDTDGDVVFEKSECCDEACRASTDLYRVHMVSGLKDDNGDMTTCHKYRNVRDWGLHHISEKLEEE